MLTGRRRPNAHQCVLLLMQQLSQVWLLQQTSLLCVQVVAPRSFAEPSDVLELEPILQQVSNWFQRFEAARAPARPSEHLPTLQRMVVDHLTI